MVRTMQSNWIGRSQGLNLDFEVVGTNKEKVSVNTTRPDTLMGVTYLAVAPQHPLAQEAATSNKEVAKFIEKQAKKQSCRGRVS
jgi:leucyl-tRNA synthetase